MSLLNVNLALLAYADAPASNSPSLRLADLKWSLLGMATDSFQNIPLSLSPGETKTIASTARAISFTNSTSFAITQPQAGTLRLSGSFGQRTSRTSGDVTTQWTLTKTGDLCTLTWTTVGSAPNFTQMTPGDSITLDAPFSLYNQGDFTIVSRGAAYVQFLNPLGVPEGPLLSQVRVYSSGPVQLGDILDLTSTQFNYLNRVNAPITRVTDQFVEVAALTSIPETVTGVTTGLFVYPNSFKWLAIVVDRKVVVGLNGDAPSSVEIEPYVEGDIVKNPGLLVKRGKVFQVQLTNPGLTEATGFVILAE